MASKGKGKQTAEGEAMARANAVDDIVDEEYKKALRLECRLLEKKI